MTTCRAKSSDRYTGYDFIFNNNKDNLSLDKLINGVDSNKIVRSTFILIDERKEDDCKGVGLAFDYVNQEIYVLEYDVSESDYYNNKDVNDDGYLICYMSGSCFYTWKYLWDEYYKYENKKNQDKELFMSNGFERVAILEKEVAYLKEVIKRYTNNSF